MYPTSGATIRADINGVVEEAFGVEKNFIGQQVMPMVTVDAKSGTYPKIQIAAGELLSAGSTVRTRGGSYGTIYRGWTTDTYDCVDRGLEEAVDDTDVKDLSSRFNLESFTARQVLRNMLTDYESRVATATVNATTFGAGTAPTAAYTAGNLATINFPLDVLAAIERVADASGMSANTIIMSAAVLNRVKTSTLLQNFVRGGAASSDAVMTINAASIANAFADNGITRVLVGKARYNTAKKGQAKSVSNIWGNTYIWVGYINPNPTNLFDAGMGATLVWNAEGGLFVSETYRKEEIRSNMVRVRQNTTEKVIDSTAGTLITTTYS
jgi:hypothetical protein